LRVLQRCRRLSRATPAEEDELEQRLAKRALALELGLGRRTVRALGRATLFGGTGFAVWELTDGGSHYLPAGVAFLLGFVGWAGAGEVERRIGLVAESGGKRSMTGQNAKPTR